MVEIVGIVMTIAVFFAIIGGIGNKVEEKKKKKDEANKHRACPVCGEQILKVAKKCKHCHEYLEAERDESGRQEQQKKKRSKRERVYYAIAIILFFSLFVILPILIILFE